MIRTRRAAARARAALRAGARDRRGATIVEFAFVAGPLMALIIATLQTSLTFFAQQTLESTGEKSVRQLLTGTAQQSGMSRSQFTTLVCSNLPVFMKCANVIVDVRTAARFADIDTAAPTITYDSSGNISNSWTFAPGAPGDITIARVMYVWNVQTGPLGFDLSTLSSGKRLLISTWVFKTERYQ